MKTQNQTSLVMKRGKTERETLELNGWGVGDILEAKFLGTRQEIIITAVGEEKFLCRWRWGRLNDESPWGIENGTTTLNVEEWRKITAS